MEVGYLEAFSKIYHHFWIEWDVRGPTKTFLSDFINEVSSYGFISAKDILFCLFLGIVFTILRYFLTAAIYKVGIASFLFYCKSVCLSRGSLVSQCYSAEVYLVIMV